ncbi:MAG: AAA family ATPase [Myxococcota bacterium]
MPSAGTATRTLDNFAPEARALVVAAQVLADERKHRELEPIHVLAAALSKERGTSEVLARAGVDASEFNAAVERALGSRPSSSEPAYLAAAALDLLERAEREASRERRAQVNVADVLNALTQELRGAAGEVWAAFRLGPGALRPHMTALKSGERALTSSTVSATAGAPAGTFVRSLASDADGDAAVVARQPELRRLLTVLERQNKCHPLLVGEAGVGKRALVTALARRVAAGDVPTSLAAARVVELQPGAFGSASRLRGEGEERARKLVSDLVSHKDPAILLVRGLEQLFAPNSGSSALVDALRPALERAELRLLATTTPDGLRKIEERDASFLHELTVLEISEPSEAEALEILRAIGPRLSRHHRVGIGEAALNAAITLARRYLRDRRLPDSAIDLLDESAARKRVQLDGLPEKAEAELRRLEALEAELALPVDAAHADEARRTQLQTERDDLVPRVKAIREQAEARRGAVAAFRALKAELDAARSERAGLGNDAARVAEHERKVSELEARVKRAEDTASSLGASLESPLVSAEDVAATLAAWTGIPVQRMLEGETSRLLELEDRLRKRVVGQDHALAALGRAVRRGRMGLRDPKRPIGSFLFLGPSGVGKTELCKALAAQLFDDERALTRLDMSEFMERHMAQRLIGAPPGYADSEQGGFLTEAVRRRPYSVLLFDEVEKAHPDVFNLLLQLLDDGRLTDGRGKTADFSNTVVIMTSNIGSEHVLEAEPARFETDEGRDALRAELLTRLRQFFRPELLNRIDEVLVFRPLGRQQLSLVVELELAQIGRLLRDRGLTLRATEAAKARLVELGYEPALGARPLKRVILRHVQDPLAEGLLAGRFAGASTVVVDAEGDAIRLDAEASKDPGVAS